MTVAHSITSSARARSVGGTTPTAAKVTAQIDLDAEFVRPLLSFEILVEQEGEPYAGRQKLTLDDIERLAVPLDVAVLEVGPVLETIERDRVCERVRVVAPCKPRLGVVRLDLAAAFVGRDVAQYLLAHVLGVPAVRKLFD